jgi:serine/threonine protein kinase
VPKNAKGESAVPDRSLFWRPSTNGVEDRAKILPDRFRYISELGQGGFGTVWKVRDRWLDYETALKVSNGSLARELSVLRTLPKDSFISVFDYVKDEQFEGYTMELMRQPWMNLADYEQDYLHCSGSDPAQSIRRIKTAFVITIQLLIALKALHGKRYERTNRWFHGDIKPANIYVDVGGVRSRADLWGTGPPQFVKIGDLGLVTRHRQRLGGGTPGYMAPEQRVQGKGSTATDIYAVGITLMQMSTGQIISDDDLKHINRIRGQLGNIPSRFLRDKISQIVRAMTLTTQTLRPSASSAARQIETLLANEDEWLVLEGLATLSSEGAFSLTRAAEYLFPKFAKRKGWINETQDRSSIIKTNIRNMYRRKILSRNGQAYSL